MHTLLLSSSNPLAGKSFHRWNPTTVLPSEKELQVKILNGIQIPSASWFVEKKTVHVLKAPINLVWILPCLKFCSSHLSAAELHFAIYLIGNGPHYMNYSFFICLHTKLQTVLQSQKLRTFNIGVFCPYKRFIHFSLCLYQIQVCCFSSQHRIVLCSKVQLKRQEIEVYSSKTEK